MMVGWFKLICVMVLLVHLGQGKRRKKATELYGMEKLCKLKDVLNDPRNKKNFFGDSKVNGVLEFPCEMTECPTFMPNPGQGNDMYEVDVTEALIRAYNGVVDEASSYHGEITGVRAFMEHVDSPLGAKLLLYLIPCYEFMRSKSTSPYGKAVGGFVFRKYADYVFGDPVLVETDIQLGDECITIGTMSVCYVLRSAKAITDIHLDTRVWLGDSFLSIRRILKEEDATFFIPLDGQIYDAEKFEKWFFAGRGESSSSSSFYEFLSNKDAQSPDLLVLVWICPGEGFSGYSRAAMSLLNNIFIGRQSSDVLCIPEMIFQSPLGGVGCSQDSNVLGAQQLVPVPDELSSHLSHPFWFSKPLRRGKFAGNKFANFIPQFMACSLYENEIDGETVEYQRIESDSKVFALAVAGPFCDLSWNELPPGILDAAVVTGESEYLAKTDIIVPNVQKYMGKRDGCIFWQATDIVSGAGIGEGFETVKPSDRQCPASQDMERCAKFRNQRRCTSKGCSWCESNTFCFPSKTMDGITYTEAQRSEICSRGENHFSRTCGIQFTRCPKPTNVALCDAVNDRPAQKVKRACGKMRESNGCVYCPTKKKCMGAGVYRYSPLAAVCSTDFFQQKC